MKINNVKEQTKILLIVNHFLRNKFMKFNSNINLPQKSIFGFKFYHLTLINSMLHTFIYRKILNYFFGSNQIQVIAGSLFNLVLNISIIILILNLLIKRKQIQKIYFIFLNSILFLYLPFALLSIGKNIQLLLFSEKGLVSNII